MLHLSNPTLYSKTLVKGGNFDNTSAVAGITFFKLDVWLSITSLPTRIKKMTKSFTHSFQVACIKRKYRGTLITKLNA